MEEKLNQEVETEVIETTPEEITEEPVVKQKSAKRTPRGKWDHLRVPFFLLHILLLVSIFCGTITIFIVLDSPICIATAVLSLILLGINVADAFYVHSKFSGRIFIVLGQFVIIVVLLLLSAFSYLSSLEEGTYLASFVSSICFVSVLATAWGYFLSHKDILFKGFKDLKK